ncbi:MFS transporter [Paraburkholderia sp.]|uniref:MFS transporter n=1 Tax=Paraburkholderia sp. TaxID=1926495 RepID=UPI0039E597A8
MQMRRNSFQGKKKMIYMNRPAEHQFHDDAVAAEAEEVALEAQLQRVTMRKVAWRILPFAVLCFFVSLVDRVNIGFAALQMNHDINLSPSEFGLAGGLFFVAYFLFEIPSNLALERFGARRWLARIMISWGIVSMATAFVTGPISLYLARFLLGAAEAGFFPGLLLYFTYWFPARYRAMAVSVLFMALPISSVIGSPISSALLDIDDRFGLHGWQWLFLVEAFPSVMLGILTLVVLRDRPHQARWLTENESNWLTRELENERRTSSAAGKVPVWQALFDKRVIILIFVYAGSSSIVNGLALWLPQIISSYHISNARVGVLNALTFALASLGMIWWGRHSDRTNERIWHTTIPLCVAAICLSCSTLSLSLPLSIGIFALTLASTYACKGPFWALASDWMPGASAAVGLAQINSLANLGGFGGSYMIGLIREKTGSFTLALGPLVLLLVVSVFAIFWGARHGRKTSIA